MPESILFDAPDLAARVERLSPSEIDRLSFGVIRIDREGTVLLYSQTEARQSGLNKIPKGENLYEVSSCFASDDFRGRITRALEKGPVDLEFGWKGDFADPTRDLRFRIQSSDTKGLWVFVERD